jgi:phosphotriesterase-related protein
MGKLHTVLGEIDQADAGIMLTHEHIIYANPGADLDHNTIYDVDEVSTTVAASLDDTKARYGLGTMVDLTPNEVGRNPHVLKATAQKTQVNIIGTTGFFPERIGIPYHFRKQDSGYLADFFLRDLTVGMCYANQLTDVKAGVIKIATGSSDGHDGQTPLQPSGLRVTELEERILRAAGRAQAATGCPINTHTEPSDYEVTNPGLEQLDIVMSEGADPAKVLIGHAFVHPNIDQMIAICERGANLQIDHIGIPWRHSSADELDDLIAKHVAELTDRGYLNQLTFSYDRFFHWAHTGVAAEGDLLNELVDMDYLWESFVPRLAKYGFGEAELKTVLVDNPARIFAWDAK